MFRRTGIVLAVVMLVSGAAWAQRDQKPTIEVFKTPTCGCCKIWVEHLSSNGFTVKWTDVADLSGIKAKHGVPSKLQSCHTGVVNGYVVEGHVPAADIHRMLKQRPKMVGLAVPGMPIGSPGMEVKGVRPQAFDVMAFEKGGTSTVYASHNR